VKAAQFWAAFFYNLFCLVLKNLRQNRMTYSIQIDGQTVSKAADESTRDIIFTAIKKAHPYKLVTWSVIKAGTTKCCGAIEKA